MCIRNNTKRDHVNQNLQQHQGVWYLACGSSTCEHVQWHNPGHRTFQNKVNMCCLGNEYTSTWQLSFVSYNSTTLCCLGLLLLDGLECENFTVRIRTHTQHALSHDVYCDQRQEHRFCIVWDYLRSLQSLFLLLSQVIKIKNKSTSRYWHLP